MVTVIVDGGSGKTNSCGCSPVRDPVHRASGHYELIGDSDCMNLKKEAE